MFCIKFKISLKSPLIISGNDKTEVNLNCLDYIPGNIFLGMAAGGLYRPNGSNDSEILDYFHNGNVQFGNAYLSVDNEKSKPIPAVWYKNKGEQLDTGIYFYHQLKDDTNIQMKQERNGYFIEKDGQFTIINAQKGVVLKSAYDSKKRSAESGKMYLYEYLEAGQTFIFEVSAYKKEYLENLLPIFKGNKHISKSKTAEFGAVYFEQIGGVVQVDEIAPINLAKDGNSFVTIYAKSNLAFINDFGAFTWSPTALDLGFENATINYKKSQLYFDKFHTRNGKRKTHDGDRLIIKKGSVFVLECNEKTTIKNSYIEKGIGVYLSEGYGKVMVNATFLDSIKKESITYYDWNDVKNPSEEEETDDTNKNTYVLVFKERLKKEKEQQKIYTSVRKFINKHIELYKGISSSQWGAIRSLVYRAKRTENPNKSVYDSIFKYVKDETNTNKSGYILHGRMGEKWVGNKRKALLEFLEIELKDAKGKEIKKTMVTDLNIEKLLLLSIEFPKRLKE